MDVITTIRQILAGFRQDNLDYTNYLNSTPAASDEAVVRLKIVEPLLKELGYKLQADLDPEQRVKEGAIDILVNANSIPVMLWELKRTQETDLARHEEQLTRYVLAKGVTHAVLCNGREVRVYLRVGDALRFAYAFPLTAFAPGVLVPPTQDEELALSAFFDAFRKEAFLEVERLKAEIAATITHPLVLSPGEPQNEPLLVEHLKREIRRLHRFVLLRFRSHQALYQEFLEEKAQRETKAAQARERLWEWVQNFEERAKTPVDQAALEAYLKTFTERWTGVEEDEFIAEVLSRSGVASHLSGVNHTNFRLRTQEFYRAFTGYARWHARRLVELRPIRSLVEDFTHWRDEIGLMAEDHEAEFCLQTVYIFITRLLLIRICENKEIITQKISDGGYKDYLDFSRRFFTNIAEAHATLLDIAYKDTGYIYGHFFSRDIFDWYIWEEEAIVRLFWVLNQFDFAQVSADLIGRIYEQYVDELERKRKGQFYTPPQVVNYILDQVGYEGPGIVGQRVLDPACGSGRFLVEAARRLIAELKKQPGLSPKELVNERLRTSLFGLDINRFACFLAEVNLLVQVLDLLKDGPTFTIERFHIYPTNTLLPRERGTEAIIGPGNGLAYETEVAELIKKRGYNPALGLDFRAGFDWVMGNPPYVRANIDRAEVATLRRHIEESNLYPSLYRHWDLFIPFIDFALKALADGGWHSFIVSDAYQTEEYARRSRERLLKEVSIEGLTFAPGVNFFQEAEVHNLIYAVKKKKPSRKHKVKRHKAVTPTLLRRDIKSLPALSQLEWRERIFRPEFEGDKGLDLAACVPLSEICYVSYGMQLSAKTEEYKGAFKTEDLIAEAPSSMHTKPYVEGKDIGQHTIYRSRWLEWGTGRVPGMIHRPAFPELFENKKVMVPRIAAESLSAFCDIRTGFHTNHTVIHAVPYHYLLPVKSKVARLLARRLTKDEVERYATGKEKSVTRVAERVIEARAKESVRFDVRFITAMLNVEWLSRHVLVTSRRGKLDFYPDDLKKYPIPPADAETQAKIACLVDEIMSAKSDVQRWQRKGYRIDERGIVLNPRPFLDTWNIPTGDLIDASGFVTCQMGGYPTQLVLEGQRLVFRKQPLSYFKSLHHHVLAYLQLYLETNRDDLRAYAVAELHKRIRIPRSPHAVQEFLDRLAAERERVMLRWMVAAQHEALIEEWAFDLYDVDDDRREKLGGHLYTFADVPPSAAFISILDSEEDNPMRRVAFHKDGAWHYRAADLLPHAILLWIHDGKNVTSAWRVT